MITVSLEGVADVVAAIRALPTSISTEPALEEIGQTFSARLRAATPKGYSGKLKDSVLYEVSSGGGEVVVGYESGVETAGNDRLDSVRKARTRGRSVLRTWVKAEELESVLSDTFDAYIPEAMSVLERSLPDVVS